jgi:hypothetical protein
MLVNAIFAGAVSIAKLGAIPYDHDFFDSERPLPKPVCDGGADVYDDKSDKALFTVWRFFFT